MTTKADWLFRAEHLDAAALRLETSADELCQEAARFRGLAEQARTIARIGDSESWMAAETAPKNRPVQVWARAEDHHWLPFTACREHYGWTRPATSDPLPFEPTHWRELPSPPASLINGQ